MVKRPKVSIVIASYNQEVLLYRAMKSIPDRDDVEVLVIDDCSTDNSYQIALDYAKEHDNFIVLRNDVNHGVAYTLNRGLDTIKGEYYLQLDCDDRFFTEELNKVIDMADMDLVWFNMQVNNGDVWCPNNDKNICDHGCLYRMSLVGNVRHPDRMADGGWFFHQDVIRKPHTERYTNLTAYDFNFPREGSLWQRWMQLQK